MANNRMFLVHVPSGLAICLATRMGYGWNVDYSNDLERKLGLLLDISLDEVAESKEQDDFALVLENSDNQSISPGNWHYAKDSRPLPQGVIRLVKG